MILGVGVDIIEIHRVSKASIKKNFLERVYTEGEIEFFKKKNFRGETLAANFSGKEAVSKALGTGFRNFSLKDIEILRDDLGKPYVLLHNNALKRAKELGVENIQISFSHDKERATAFVILQGGGSVKEEDFMREYDNIRDNREESTTNLCDDGYEKFIGSLIPKRDEYSHKGDYGRIFIIAGSKGLSGAAHIATEGALRAGGGLVTLGTHQEIMDIMAVKLSEAMTVALEDKDMFIKKLNGADVVGIGPGLGDNNNTLEIIKYVLYNSHCPIVIDADGLNAIKDNIELLRERKEPIIITPHEGEMARLTKLSISYIRDNRVQVAKKFAKDNEIIVLLKGKNTIITDGDKVFINPTGNSAMASGGMGDALTGIICSLIGQRLSPINGALCGAYVHGKAGDILQKEKYCVLARDILDKVPYLLKELSDKFN